MQLAIEEEKWLKFLQHHARGPNKQTALWSFMPTTRMLYVVKQEFTDSSGIMRTWLFRETVLVKYKEESG